MKKLLLLSTCLVIWQTINAQNIIQHIKAKVTYFDDVANTLGNQMGMEDTIEGTITYDAGMIDENTDPTVGDYHYYTAPNGIELFAPNGITFKTDASSVDFLVESVDRLSSDGGDHIVFRSYNNVYSVGNDATDKHIAWQLDNPDGTVLNSDELPQVNNLSLWDQVFALTIEANDFPNGLEAYFIRATVFEIKTDFAEGINSLPSKNQTLVFPNPAHSFFTLVNSPLDASVIIENLNGNVVRTTSAAPRIDISGLLPGLYIVKAIGSNSTTVTKLMIN